jgi:hypothetical protein
MRRFLKLRYYIVELEVLFVASFNDSFEMRKRVNLWRCGITVRMDSYFQRMVRIALRIARIWHPVLGKSDRAARSRYRLEFVPVLSGCLFHPRPDPEIKVAALGTPVVAAGHRNGHNEYAGYPDQVRRRTIWLKCHVVYDRIYSDSPILCDEGGGSQRKQQRHSDQNKCRSYSASLYRFRIVSSPRLQSQLPRLTVHANWPTTARDKGLDVRFLFA